MARPLFSDLILCQSTGWSTRALVFATIRDSVGANFSWTVKIGVTAGPQGAWSVTEDLEITFDYDNGQCRMPAQTRIAVKPDDDDADLISAREMAHFGLALAVGSGPQSPSLR